MWGLALAKKIVPYLTSSVDNLRRKVLALVPDDFAECVLDCRVVALDEVAVDELHGQTRLAWRAPRQLSTAL